MLKYIKLNYKRIIININIYYNYLKNYLANIKKYKYNFYIIFINIYSQFNNILIIKNIFK